MIKKSAGFILIHIWVIHCSLIGQVYGQDKSLTVSWSPNKEADILAYKVYRGTRPNHYDQTEWVAGVTKREFNNLRDGVRYYFAVSAVDQWGNESPLSREVSAVAGIATLPVSLSLENNYPNPFNTETVIEMNLPGEMFVKVVIFNSVGQEIRELTSGTYQPGKHLLYWDGLDKNGVPAASGVYFYQLESGNTFTNKCMTLLR